MNLHGCAPRSSYSGGTPGSAYRPGVGRFTSLRPPPAATPLDPPGFGRPPADPSDPSATPVADGRLPPFQHDRNIPAAPRQPQHLGQRGGVFQDVPVLHGSAGLLVVPTSVGGVRSGVLPEDDDDAGHILPPSSADCLALSFRLRRLGGWGSVRGSPCGEPARLCPPFFLQRGYPRERISSGSGALYLTAPPLLRRLRPWLATVGCAPRWGDASTTARSRPGRTPAKG